MRRLKPREAKYLAQSHMAGRWWNWVSKPRKSVSTVFIFTDHLFLKIQLYPHTFF